MTTGKCYEYRSTMQLPDGKMNELGLHGWELVSVVAMTGATGAWHTVQYWKHRSHELPRGREPGVHRRW